MVPLLKLKTTLSAAKAAAERAQNKKINRDRSKGQRIQTLTTVTATIMQKLNRRESQIDKTQRKGLGVTSCIQLIKPLYRLEYLAKSQMPFLGKTQIAILKS